MLKREGLGISPCFLLLIFMRLELTPDREDYKSELMLDQKRSGRVRNRISGDARSGTSSLDDLTGSTFTITSLGRDGGLGATPIINHPEMAILGVHKAREKPVVRNGQIVVRRIMNLSSSFDHRVIDGADGARLIQHLKRMLEHPAMIFM